MRGRGGREGGDVPGVQKHLPDLQLELKQGSVNYLGCACAGGVRDTLFLLTPFVVGT